MCGPGDPPASQPCQTVVANERAGEVGESWGSSGVLRHAQSRGASGEAPPPTTPYSSSARLAPLPGSLATPHTTALHAPPVCVSLFSASSCMPSGPRGASLEGRLAACHTAHLCLSCRSLSLVHCPAGFTFTVLGSLCRRCCHCTAVLGSWVAEAPAGSGWHGWRGWRGQPPDAAGLPIRDRVPTLGCAGRRSRPRRRAGTVQQRRCSRVTHCRCAQYNKTGMLLQVLVPHANKS
ncbi:hypothetical protein E2C01_018684 [Portunus trituberculatus]|uniref:Uncharacterized protein n=1 Tax=Portunus trituberculatus TaxID=210409 RepID=A0A5B7DX09_PORTR|nr:hypothetical protein [Portunus trituberculatus]